MGMSTVYIIITQSVFAKILSFASSLENEEKQASIDASFHSKWKEFTIKISLYKIGDQK